MRCREYAEGQRGGAAVGMRAHNVPQGGVWDAGRRDLSISISLDLACISIGSPADSLASSSGKLEPGRTQTSSMRSRHGRSAGSAWCASSSALTPSLASGLPLTSSASSTWEI